jgi:ferric-dicitrate binding protein FerR (iron transport regulator)
MSPELERAMSEIREETPDAAAIEAAAARVWTKLADSLPGTHLRTCADFQDIIPEYRARRLSDARATLLQDHLHNCVACRKIYEGRVGQALSPAVVSIGRRNRLPHVPMRWAVAAGVLVAAGLSVYVILDRVGPNGQAVVQTVNGTLYEVSPDGIRPVSAGQSLPDGVELRTAKDSDAMIKMHDGSTVELRERSGVTNNKSGRDLTIRLSRGSIILHAAHRSSGHLFVVTSDCRVAVTGTIFGVSAGVKGSRVSVVQGEVHVTQDNSEKVLHPGQQAVTSDSLEPVSVKDDISWSRNRDQLLQELAKLQTGLSEIHLPKVRYESRLLGRLPASTILYASIPNLADYLTEAQSVFNRQLAESPELRAAWTARGINIDPVIEKLRAASGYLGDEIAVIALRGNQSHGPVFLAETRREGFPEFLKKQMPEAAIVERPSLVVFGPHSADVETVAAALDSPDAGFKQTPFYARIAEAYKNGAGILICVDLSDMAHGPQNAIPESLAPKPQFVICEQKEVGGQTVARAALGFNGPRSGIAAWLAQPAPMGSLDYVSTEATLLGAFVFKNPSAIIDEVAGLVNRSGSTEQTFSDLRAAGFDPRTDLADTLGGEFSLALDGPIMPVPSWKLVIETYDPVKLNSTIQKIVAAYNQKAAQTGDRPIQTGQETVDGRTYYTIAHSKLGPIAEMHYTFADGYLIAGPSRALISKALQVKASGTSIARSQQFISLTPHDRYVNFSGVIYQHLGTTLAPLVGLFGSMVPSNGRGQNALQGLGDMKPLLLTAYGEPDQISVASTNNLLGAGMTGLITGNLQSVVQTMVPFGGGMGGGHRELRQAPWANQGTKPREPAFHN